MKKAIFVSKVGNLEGYKMEMEVNKMFPTRPTKYKVIKEVKVSEEEYKKLTNNFFKGWEWLPETSHINGIANCVRVNKREQPVVDLIIKKKLHQQTVGKQV